AIGDTPAGTDPDSGTDLAPAPAPAAPTVPAPADGGDTLPQRRRRVRPAPAAESVAKPPSPPLTPERAAAALGALQSGTTAARSAAESEGSDPR
ncbi:MAG: hypothetical protein QOF98_3457, partial [Streptomyces sp.]|nr:hypothetical protein [Streptomyces sp.]